MQILRIKKIIEYHDGCFMIDPQLIWSKMQTLKGFPVDERTLALKKKMEAING